jgi:predicted transcriptional regulator
MTTTVPPAPHALGDSYLLPLRPGEVDVRRAMQLVAMLPDDTEDDAAVRAVLTNMVDVATRSGYRDFERAAELSSRLGYTRVADIQGELDGCLSGGPHVPFATAAIINLSDTSGIEAALVGAGRAKRWARRVAAGCANAAFWLLMVDIDPRFPASLPTTVDDLLFTVQRSGADVWRQILANIAVNPWGRDATRLAELARAADLESAAQAIERCASVYRERVVEDERAEVVRKVRRSVAISGCSQRVFAQYLGITSSRLSAYLHGYVVPSAAIMLRMEHRAAELASASRAR